MKEGDLSTQGVKDEIQRLKVEATGTFCNSLLDDEEDARPVIMGEDGNEWQCTKLIRRQMWKEMILDELNDFRKFMKYAYGPDVEEAHFTAENPYCEDDNQEKEISIPIVLQRSIEQRKRQRDNEHGCERQSTWDVPPELFDREGYRGNWARKSSKDVKFQDVVTQKFNDQWEFIWQDWEKNPLTRAFYVEKKKKME